MRDRDSTTVPQTQLAEKTIKLILIHASVDSLNLLNSVNSENSAPFRENSIRAFIKSCSIDSRNKNKIQHVKSCAKQNKAHYI